MIYFDNAATTLKKPDSVAQAIICALQTFGGPSRGSHEPALAASLCVFEAREKIAALVKAPAARNIVFSGNATEALNIAISGLVGASDQVITTAASHNSVLRPLYRKRKNGARLSICPIDADGSLDYEAFEGLFCSDTRLVVATHASNLTGDVYDIARMSRIAHDKGAILMVDAAQTAGLINIDMERDGIDILVLSGHKSLFGPQGVGGLCVADGIEIPAFVVGGSGTHTYDEEQPRFMPERLEAGTLNSHGIAGLSAGIDYVNEKGTQAILEETLKLVEYFEEGLGGIPPIRTYGGHAGFGRTGVVALNIGSLDSALVSDLLATEYGICTRSGAHCAPLMHKALGTVEQGIVRFSFSHRNTRGEIDVALDALSEIARRAHAQAESRSIA